MKKLSFFQRCMSSLIDFTAVFFMYTIIGFLISYFYFLPFLPGFLIGWMLYYIVCYGIWGKTIGTSWFGSYIQTANGEKPPFIRILLREVFAGFPIFFLLIFLWLSLFSSFFAILNKIHPALLQSEFLKLYVILYISILPLLTGIALILLRRKIFKLQLKKDASQIATENVKAARKKVLIAYAVLLVAAGLSRTVNIYQTNCWETMPGEIARFVPRPSAHSVKKYTDYLETDRQNINDYIFGLFEKYDHVILCERLHPEYTQYDMIYGIVGDERFSKHIGTLFTELGCVDARDDFQKLIATPFPNDTVLEKELSAFMMKKNQTVYLLWRNTNWFDFLKKVYQLNQKDGVKVNVAFSDEHWTSKEDEKIRKRDSLMASNIISTIRSDSLKKSLTIMNYRHAYLISPPLSDIKNCGNYMTDAFPGKVANVLINTVTMNYISDRFLPQIQHGKWDVAFEQMLDSAFAFNLKDSPFGKDRFDHYPFISPLSNKKYEEMFTGVIYYLPLHKHIFSHGYPYMIDGENEEILLQRAALISESEYNRVKDYFIPYLKGLERGKRYDSNNYTVINFLENGIFILIYATGLLIILYLGIGYFLTKSRQP